MAPGGQAGAFAAGFIAKAADGDRQPLRRLRPAQMAADLLLQLRQRETIHGDHAAPQDQPLWIEHVHFDGDGLRQSFDEAPQIRMFAVAFEQPFERRLRRVGMRPAGQPVTGGQALDAAPFTARALALMARPGNVPQLAGGAVRPVVKIAVQPQAIAHAGAQIQPHRHLRQRRQLLQVPPQQVIDVFIHPHRQRQQIGQQRRHRLSIQRRNERQRQHPRAIAAEDTRQPQHHLRHLTILAMPGDQAAQRRQRIGLSCPIGGRHLAVTAELAVIIHQQQAGVGAADVYAKKMPHHVPRLRPPAASDPAFFPMPSPDPDRG